MGQQCAICNESKWYPRLHYTKDCYQVERANPYPLSNTDVSTLGILYPVWTLLYQRDMGILMESPTKGHGDD